MVLLDVNVLVALVMLEHEHHQRAIDWLLEQGIREGWATCIASELAAIRICMQISSPRWTADKAAREVRWFRINSRTSRYLPALESPTQMLEVQRALTSKQVNDRYLLGFAREHGARLVTFDRGIASYGGTAVICLTASDSP